jgi:hypothetical protein
VYVHIGLPKTGTTSLQLTMGRNRRSLADQGLLYPGAPRNSHFLDVLDLLQMRFGAVGPADVAGRWEELRAEIGQWPGRALVSHELLAGADSEEVARLVDQLSPASVHAVVGARDMSRLLPAVWQDRAKNRTVESWTAFRHGVAAGPDAAEAHPFWRLHDAVKVVRTWLEHVPADRVHVVTLPARRAEADLLIQRFCGAVGVDPGGFTLADDPANASIGGLELAALRQLNTVARQRLDRSAYTTLVKRFLVPQILAARPDQVKVTLPESDRPWIEAYTERLCASISSAGVDVAGTLDDLQPTGFTADDPADPAQTGEFSDDLVARALAEVTVELLALAEAADPPSDAGAAPATAAATAPRGRAAKARAIGSAIRRLMSRPADL